MIAEIATVMRQRAELADMYHRVKPTWIGVRRAKTLQETLSMPTRTS